MTIRKKSGGTRVTSKGTTGKEMATSSSNSTDMTTVETVEVVSSTSVVEEARQIVESESRSSMTEVTSASREVIMDSKGNVIKVIETPPETVGQSSSTYKMGKSSEDFIAAEQTQTVKQGKPIRDGPRNTKEIEIHSDRLRGETSGQTCRSSETQCHSESRAETVQKSVSSTTVLETSSSMEDYHDHLSKTTISNGEQKPQVQTSSKSFESRLATEETHEERTKDGQTVSSTTRIRETGEKHDDNGHTTASKSRSVDNETTVVPSDLGHPVKHTDDVIRPSNKVVHDSSTASESTTKEIVTRCSKPGQSTWDGTFISESTRPVKDRSIARNVETSRGDRDSTGLDVAKVDRLVSKAGAQETTESSVHVSEYSSVIDQRVSSTVIHDTKIIIDEGRTGSVQSYDRDTMTRDTIDFADGQKLVTVESPQKGSTRHSRPGESAWDGTFVTEKHQEPRKRNVSDASEVYIDGKPIGRDVSKDRSPSRRVTRPGDSSWNGQFVYEKPQDGAKRSPMDKTVVKRSDKRHDSVDVQDITEEMRRTIKPDSTTRSYRPGQSTWDGSFVHEKPQPPDRRRKDTRRPTDSVIIRDVTEDNSINEAEISTAAYVVEHSSSQQSFTDVKDSSLSSVHDIVYDVHPTRQDVSSSRPGSPEKTPKGKDTRLTKPGSSTWDGTFVTEKPSDEKRPPSRESVKENLVDTVQPESPLSKPKKHISDTTLDINDTQVSSTSEMFSNSIVMEQSTVHESYSDSSNLDFSSSSMETVITRNGVPTTIQKSVTIEEGAKSPDKKPLEPKSQRPKPEDLKSTEKRPKSPEKTDRSVRPTKPGASTWDGSFVYEKSAEKPSDKTPTDASRRPGDKQSSTQISPKNVPSSTQISPKDVPRSTHISPKDQSTYRSEKSITLSDTSKDVQTSEFVTSTTLERTLVSDSEVLDSNKFSTTVTHQVEDKRQKRPKSPEKSTLDRSTRPTKPGASTWDGSFVYEKPQDQRKKPTDQEKRPTDQGKGPKDSPVTEKPKDQGKGPKDSPDKPFVPKEDTTHISVIKHDVNDVRDINDSTDIEVIQRSSYVIDQSSSFTSVQDVRDVVEERVISEFTTDARKDVRDVTRSTTEFIDKEQVTSMVARDVVDDTQLNKFIGSVPKSPADSPRKTSPERPGYPRGIPGLREDNRPKPIPAAGKPSRPPQRDDSPKRTTTRPQSPEKPRDYVSPTWKPLPAAGKPSRPEERPAPGKSSRPVETTGKPGHPADKPKRGDQTPDSLDEDDAQPGKLPDILSKIPLKEQCICELCTCGQHRCPHNLPQDQLEFPREPIHAVTSYREEYDEKHVDRQTIRHHEDHLRMEGEFVGERRTDYVATRGERAPVRRPQDNLRPEGAFDSTTTTELVFTGMPGERPSPVRRNTYTKVEGEFMDATTTRSEYIDHRTVQRAEIIKRTDNLTVGEGEFTGTSHVKEDFHGYDTIERQPRRRLAYTDEEDRFYSRTDDLEQTTTTQEQYRNFDQTDYRSTTVIRRDDNLRPEGPFEGVPRTKDDYVVPALTRRPEPQKPKDNLRPEGSFEGRPKDDYKPTRGERADVKRPQDNLRPEGPFEGRPKDDFSPKRGERPEVKRPEDNLRPEGTFEGRPKDDFTPKTAEQRPEVKRPEDNLKPEGPFEGRPKDDYMPTRGERADVKRPQDNLKPEGLFEGRPKDDFSPKRGERPEVKRPEDNLRPEGPFEGRPKDDFTPKRAERPEVKRPQDNLRPEGPFEGRPKDDFTPKTAERPEVRRPQDNLRPEGEFVDRPREEYTPGEKRTPIRHPDNLYPEGEFERPRAMPYGPGERAPIVRHPDNLFPEGDFPDRERAPFTPAERRTPIKHGDNLRPEGPFEGRPKDDYGPTKGERADVRRPEDNLKPEGPFEGRPKDDFSPKRAERPEVKRPQDNLRPEGQFEVPEKPVIGPAERRTPIKHPDNLRPEGDFERPDHEKYRPAERPEVKKPKDNLKPEGEFERPRPETVGPAERRTPIKHPDNLKPEGEFVGKPKDDFSPTKGDRAVVKRPEDNLRPEGPFEGRPKDDYQPVRGDRVEIVKRTDNLRMEGDIETYRSRDDYTQFLIHERAEVTKYQDNLRMEGEFTDVRTRDDFKVVRGERVDIVKHLDNLKPEGPFEGRPKDDYLPKRAERPEIKRPEDNLRPEGEFERPKPQEFKPADRPVVIRPKDNLKPEGDFVGRPKEEVPKRGERADIKKPKDNLYPEGEMEMPEKKPFGPAERRTPIKHSDKLRPEGDFERPRPDEFRPAERPIVKRPQDNLYPEGEMEMPEKKPFGPAERRTPIKHSDKLRPEGDFERPRPDEFRPAERPIVKRPQDNLYPEGEMEMPEKKPFGPAERRTPIKHSDKLRPEGDFERPRPDEFRPAERPIVKRPQDNLYPEGEMEMPEKKPFGPAERRTPIKHSDNLRPEGDFERPLPNEFRPAERPVVKKPQDNLKPEGDFVGRPRELAPTRGDRADVKRPEDNLRPEGTFDRPEKKPYGPAERRTPIKHPDNLKPEGDFERPEYEQYRPAERPEVKKPKDNLKPEGEFERPQSEHIGPAERRSPIKHPDNLKIEGDFVRKPRQEAPKRGERADVKRPQDNLRPEGEFERPEKSPVRPAEKRTPIKHPDNLKPEGEFVGRPKDDYKPTRGERADVKKPEDNLKPEGPFEVRGERVEVVRHQDNLRPEGPFEGRPKDDYTPKRAERPEMKRPEDNLKPEGEFERPEKKPVGPAERRSPIKHDDNLKPEGEFMGRPKEQAPKKGERADVKKPKDNLKPEGTFERPEKKPFGPAERRSPIKHPDNLRPEGDFVGRPKEETPTKGERADVKRPEDNLRPEGEFERPQKSPVGPAERRTPIRHEDNLHPEGEFAGRPKDDFSPKRTDRPVQKKPKDNLKPEGEFVGKPRDDYKPTRGERTEIVVHRDNLKMEGEIDVHRSRDDYKTVTKIERVDVVRREDNLRMEGEFVDIKRRDDYRVTRGERSEIVKHEDNLRLEGDFERPDKSPVGPAERRSPIKHPDNLKLEGQFAQRPKAPTPTKGDRAAVKKPKDNLRPEGDFERPEKSPVGPAERRSPIKHPDNLYPEGDFVGRPRQEIPTKGERADVKRPKDNLHPEGEFAKRTPQKVGPAERRTPIRHEDNLHPEGDFYMSPKDDFTPKRGDRAPLKKPQDNLRPEGEMDVSPSSKDDYRYVNGERVEVRRHEDNLRMEGEIDVRRSRDDYKKITKVERVDIRKREDNLKIEGEFIDVRRRDDYTHVVGERIPVKKHPDNLRPEGEFERPHKSPLGPGERRTPIRHPDNLRPEGDFERRSPEKVGPVERRSPIRHSDNLKPEGDFVGRPRDDFTPKRGERAEVVRREDNLKMTGDFQDTTSQRSTYTVVRGERAEIKRHEDNLKVSTGTMETKTTNRDTFAPTKKEDSPTSRTVSRRRHMESSITLGDDNTTMSTTTQRNYNTFTKRTAKEVAAKISSMESDTRRSISTESKTLENGTTVTTIKKTATSAQTGERVSSAQNVQHHAQHITSDHHAIHPSITDNQSHRDHTIDQNQRQLDRQHQDSTKRDYVNTQHMDSRQSTRQKQLHEQHTLSTQARYNSSQSSSAEFRQAISGQSIERSQMDSAVTKTSHHRKNVISSSSADVNNSVLHRRGVTTSTEALHTISSTAADQKKSLSNLAESGQYISNSSQSSDRKSLTSKHRSNRDGNPWASSTYERPQRIVRQDNLTVGGKFYSHSEAKSYGNFSTQKVERVQRQSNVSHISLGDGSNVTSSMYKREYAPRHKGPCPATLLEAKQAPFKHTRDTPKHNNVAISNDFTEEQRNNPDPSIERIFRSPSETSDALNEPKLRPETGSSKIFERSEAVDKRVRVKRDNNAKKTNHKSINEASKPEEKRSIPSKGSKSTPRSGRSSKTVQKFDDKSSADYESVLGQDRSEYADEFEDESAGGPVNKGAASYKGSELKLAEDSEKFIDQDERSSLYDDFETKDVVKRGISGPEDYEEFEEESFDESDDIAALDERESSEEDAGKRKVHGDTRVKREHVNSKRVEKREDSGKGENPASSNDPAKSIETSLQDVKTDKEMTVAEGKAGKMEDAKIAEDQANMVNPSQVETDNNDNPKDLNGEGQMTVERKTQEEVSLSNEKKAPNEPPILETALKLEDSKVADGPSPEATKVELPGSNPEARVSDDAGKLENSVNSDTATGEQAVGDYEKRVEEQIQRKIASIKDEIKREIAQNQKMKEIEYNNAKFDELLDQEEEEEEEGQQVAEAQPSGKKENPSKRSVQILDKSQTRNDAEKRSIKRKKRQNEQEKIRGGAAVAKVEKKSTRDKMAKRSVGPIPKMMPLKKRSSPRQVYLVRRDRNAGKKRRRRRSRISEESLAGDVSDSNLRGNDKRQSSSRLTEDEKTLAEVPGTSLERKSGSVASLTGNEEELGPQASEYGDAFGGLQGESGLALARFKRIKRVLRPQSSKA
ncbi:hypothetical protein WN55_02762 [Dufourea novaeangliae]|uniref:Titin n=1 Tax=Dufourea novaeangliae TaxID=178035 RepID=A0A154NZV4_DUFNO|nr:hypothetical protein WN55_02762 [Dufourea novaeangliae]